MEENKSRSVSPQGDIPDCGACLAPKPFLTHFFKDEKYDRSILVRYIGTKDVMARPMNEQTAMSLGYRTSYTRGECLDREGYHVRYFTFGGAYYDSWVPAEIFEQDYRPADTPLDRMIIELKQLHERFMKGHQYYEKLQTGKAVIQSQLEMNLLHDQLILMSKLMTVIATRARLSAEILCNERERSYLIPVIDGCFVEYE